MSHKVLLGHALDELRKMPSNSVDCIVTSPPYWGLRDYGTPAVIFGGKRRCKHNWEGVSKPASHGRSDPADTKNRHSATRFTQESQVCCKCGAWRGQLGLEPTMAMFVEHMAEIFRECRRVLKRSGTMWVNFGDSYYTGAGVARAPGGGVRGKEFHGPQKQPNRISGSAGKMKRNTLTGQPWRVAFALIDDGWVLRSEIIWHKPSPMPESAKNRPTRAHETVFLFTKKSAGYYYDYDAIKEPVTGNAHTRGSGVNPKAVAGWDSGPGAHSVLEHNLPDLGGPNSRMRKSRTPNGTDPQPLDARIKNDASERIGRGPGWRSRQNASFSASVTELVSTRNARTVWTFATQPYKGGHYATFPEELPKRCILAGCPVGGVVLDPFVGTGTTMQVAIELGREAIGIDLDPHNVPRIEQRLSTVQRPLMELLEEMAS